jgi:drug/metabolite transporter (DMT)-like permease
MSSSIVRALAALVFAGLLWMQSRGVREQPRRRRAFELAAGALLALAALQFSLAAGVMFVPLLYATIAVGLVLLVAAVVAYISSFRDGEMRGQAERVADAVREYRERRTTNDER